MSPVRTAISGGGQGRQPVPGEVSMADYHITEAIQYRSLDRELF